MFFENTVRRCVMLATLALPLAAAAFPTQPVEWVVPYSAGGGSDVVARVIAAEMTKALG
jgi:tripartite-type tricarboxylate transporter receptor subunit TctC